MSWEDKNNRSAFQKIDREYRRDIFVTEAQPVLTKLFFGGWTIFAVLSFGIFLLYFLYYFFLGSVFDNRAVLHIVQNTDSQHVVAVARGADDLKASGTKVFSLGDSYYDLHTTVKNSNEDWYAEFSYVFSYGDEQTEEMRGFLLPNEERSIVALNQEFMKRPANANFVIKDIDWQRIDSREIGLYSTWLEDHENFLVTESAHGLEGESGDTIPKSSFVVENASLYDYWNPEFLIEVIRGGSVVGVNTFTIPSFASGESRKVEVYWFGESPSSGTLRVTPQIPYLNKEVYFTEKAEQSLEALLDRPF